MFAAGEVRTAGRGGLAVVSRIAGLARSTINRGEDDLDGEELPKGQVRGAGAGRKAVVARDLGLVPALRRLVEPATLGDPMRPLLWVSKSMDQLAAILTGMGIRSAPIRRCVPSGMELHNQTPPVRGIAALIVMGVVRLWQRRRRVR